MAALVKPRYHAILAVDTENSGGRPDSVKAWLRQRLYEIVDTAMREAGIDASAVSHPQDRGDGAIWLLSGDVPKTELTSRFIHYLRVGLRAYAQVSSPQAALRLRVALHAGEVAHDAHGWVGIDLDTACHLLDLPVVREALASSPEAELVLAVSDTWYSSVVNRNHPEIDARDFRQIPFRVKAVDTTAWVALPGHGPSAPREETPAAPEAVRPGGTGGGDGGDEKRSGATVNTANFSSFSGAMIQAQQVYGGNHYESHGRGEGR
ncbi:hypothetical protein FOF52_14325 [Thermobifida alba]|uniref:Uncharacterized protein n=1 Tax=Thermobifida alba TaxID=53522 RepID=A0ABY4L524_THEAE|nr:hypothetical protein [Thermobifida alba]UPT21996.1 hypothetical protein FOF52_14325 [Thermobifida alba]